MLMHESGLIVCDVEYCSLCTAMLIRLSGILCPVETRLASVTVRPLLLKALTLQRHRPYEQGEESKVKRPYVSEAAKSTRARCIRVAAIDIVISAGV
jgi:hypothetical protein